MMCSIGRLSSTLPRSNSARASGWTPPLSRVRTSSFTFSVTRGIAKDEQSAVATLPATMGMLKNAKENRRATFVIEGQFRVFCIRDYSSLLRSAIEFLGGVLQVESSVRYRFWAKARAELFPALKIGVKKSGTNYIPGSTACVSGKAHLPGKTAISFRIPTH